jgi:hypothetical protein
MLKMLHVLLNRAYSFMEGKQPMRRLMVMLGVVILAGSAGAVHAVAAEEVLVESERPIALELAESIDTLTDEITAQATLLATTQTDRERELIRNHLRFLQDERDAMEDLLVRLVGEDFHTFEDAMEQQERHAADREERVLEQDERFPSP